MTRIAWLGVGAMGASMARRVSEAGYELVVWNRTSGRAEVLGAEVAATPADAVREADVVITMLADSAAVRDVLDGMRDALTAGTTVIDMSTIGPEAVAWLRDALPAGVTLLDAPVLGSVAEAEAGTLRLLVGASDEAIAAQAPLLSVLGEVLHMGPTGSGAAAKLVANSALLSTVAVLGETIALADGLGLPSEATWQILGLTPLAGQAARRRPAIESGAYPPRFGLAMARKDADLIVAAATSTGRDPRLAQAARAWFAGAEQAGLGGQAYTAVLGHILASGTTPTVHANP